MDNRRMIWRSCAFILGFLLLAGAGGDPQSADAPKASDKLLRVCADPNNLPFSDDKGEGFENKLAELVAHDMGRIVAYTWWAQRRGFVRNTLKAGHCDVIMGVPADLDMVAATKPYYRSTYVFVWRRDRDLDLSSITDPRLRSLKIGVHLLGDDGFNTPPAEVLGEQGITGNVVGYSIYGDYRTANPPARLLDAVAKGDIDVAAVWGPFAGYFGRKTIAPLALAPIAENGRFAPIVFQYDIAMGVRKQDHALQAALNKVIQQNQPAITALLESYGVPLVSSPQKAALP
jgi:mxaJ protein